MFINIVLATEMSIGGIIGLIIGCIIAGGIAGYFIARKVFTNQLKKNPPINEKMIRALYMQMGRKPSEAQVKAAMKAMNQYK